MIMMVKTPGSQMGSPATAKEEERRCGGEWREKCSASEVVVDVDGAKSFIPERDRMFIT